MHRSSVASLGAVVVFLLAAFPVSAQQAGVGLTQPLKTALIGETVTFCVTFENLSPTSGLGPFLDFYSQWGGMNISKTSPIPAYLCDGIKFISATVISTNPPVPLTPELVNNPPCAQASFSIVHPYAAQGFANVPSPASQQLTTLPLPFGSYTRSQPRVVIEVKAQIDQNADHNQPLMIGVRGGFRWNGPPSLSIPLALPWKPQTFKPLAARLENVFLGNDKEMVSGPSRPQDFDISVQVAPAPASATAVTVNACLTPSGAVWLPSSSCSSWTSPLVPPGTTHVPSPQFIFKNVPPINQPAACTISVNSTASITGTWIPPDPADTTVLLSESVTAQVSKRALSVRKSPIVSNPNGPLPGGQIVYHVDIDVGDDVRYGNMVITDTLTDGQTYVPGSGRLMISDMFGSLMVFPIDPFIDPVIHNVLFSYVCPPAKDPCRPPMGPGGGSVPLGNRYRFRVSDAMIQNAASAPHNLGILSGGASTTAPSNATPAVGWLEFTVDITDAFSNTHPGDDGNVSKDDPLYDNVLITGKQYTNHVSPLVPTPIATPACSDRGSSCLAVLGDTLRKEVFAINGVQIPSQPPLTPVLVQRGDVVTFHLWKTIPSGDVANLTVTDWFSRPVFDANTFNHWNNIAPCTIAVLPLAAGDACYDVPGTVPPVTLIVNTPPDNRITFDLGSFNDPANQPAPIHLYASVAVSSDPFPDELLLTNESEECETNSYDPTKRICQAAIAQVKVQEPSLVIRKTVYCAGGCNQPSCAPGCPTPFAVTDATIGSLGSPSGTAGGNDIVTYVVSIQNIGGGPNGAYDVQLGDTLGSIPGTIINGSFCFRRGDGTQLFNIVDYTLFPVSPTTAWTLNLNNPIPPRNATTTLSGANIILAFFSVKLNPPAAINVGGNCPDNTATLQRYTNMPGGQNFVGAFGMPIVLPVTASICTGLQDPNKRIAATSEPHTVTPDMTIGETADYEVSVVIPEGTVPVPGIRFADALPINFQMQAGWTATPSTSGFTNAPGLPAVILNTGTLNQPVFIVPPFVNSDNDAGCELLMLTFKVLVMNTVTNAQPQTKLNRFTARIGTGPTITSPWVSVNIVEPKLDVMKTVTYFPAPSGLGSAQYNITITNNSGTTAFDVTVQDPMPACMAFAPIPNLTIVPPAGVTWTGTLTSGFLLQPGLKPGETATISFLAVQKCLDCAKLENSVRAEWTSVPGPNGTAIATPGASGTINGERRGTGAVNKYFAIATASICGKVCGVKYADLDGDGTRDPNEPALPGWPVNAGSVVSATNASGSYCLDLLPGPNSICEGGFPNWTPTQPATPPCTPITVSANTTANVDFGNQPACYATVCGTKTTPPPNSQGVAGWTIIATPGAQGGPVITATTQPNGSYCMTLFGSGVYTISEAVKTGWLQLIPTSGAYRVNVECRPAGTGVDGVDPNHVDFVNKNVCANFTCNLVNTHCVVGPNGNPTCVRSDTTTQ